MKKILLILGVIIFTNSFNLQAQHDPKVFEAKKVKSLMENDTIYCLHISQNNPIDDVKPQSQMIAFELNCKPFGDTPINLSYLKARYYINQNSVVRLGFNLRIKNNSYDDGLEPLTETVEKFNEFGIHPGYEFHFNRAKRVTPYFGGEFNFTNRNCEVIYSGATEGKLIGSNGSDRAFSSFGLNAFTGVDIIIMKHIYIGVEFGYGFEKIKNKEVKLEDAPSPLNREQIKFNLGVNFNNSFRLGFYF